MLVVPVALPLVVLLDLLMVVTSLLPAISKQASGEASGAELRDHAPHDPVHAQAALEPSAAGASQSAT